MNATANNDKYNAPFPTRLRKLLADNHVSQQTLADYVDVKRQTISAYASGSVEPTMSKLIGIAKYFGKSVDYIVGEHECTTPDNQAISERLGLCDEAITSLEKMQHNPGEWGWALDAINDLLGCQEGNVALDQIDKYLYSNFDIVYRSYGNDQIDAENPITEIAVPSMHRGNPAVLGIPPEVLQAGFLQEIGRSLDVLREGIKAHTERKEADNEQARKP